ncbi:nuclease-related domain-containing protein [Methyloversatilis universalis]|uniref:nuclease-related domain-containing protein n=1 Tax=Methyloversatilis universalis TaxID=378211 RepID=UPI00035E9684|nr:nuclease-related domain-containing protein [Methyloversatilis universalis]
MDGLVAQIGIALIVVGPMVVSVFLGGFLLQRRKAIARARRKSPIGFDLLRPPGHGLGEQIEQLQEDLWEQLFRLMFVPTAVVALYFGQIALLGDKNVGLGVALIYGALTVANAAYCLRQLLKIATELDKLKAGYDAELAVGQELNQLMHQGALVFHDFPAEQFNIDHVVVARQGVFAVETKGYTKLAEGDGRKNATVVFDGKKLVFPNYSTTKPLEQSARQAKWLTEWLSSATGTRVRAAPVLALPGWFVDPGGEGTVIVLSGRMLKTLLEKNAHQSLTDQTIQQIAHQLGQRCRDVTPLYSR